jgi:hypothetical protein
MKKTINYLQHVKVLLLKSIAVVILLTVFTSTFGQANDPSGFDTKKERQKAIAKGVHEDEIESFVNMQRSYYEFLKEAKEKGSYRKVIPPMTSSFTRKSFTTDCPGTFENGTVSPWSGYKSINNLSGLDSFVNDQKDFTSGGVQTVVTTGFDGVIATLPKVRSGGGSYSLKLGNSSSGGQVDMAARTITATGTCISFWYALVFQRPSTHPDVQTQPFFIFRVRDADSNIIASFVKSSSLDTTFFTKLDPSGSVVYRGWTQQTLNLGCKYIDKNVTIEVTVSDCSWGGHYGYAYIDDVCFEDCMACCDNCQELLRYPGLMSAYPVITKSYNTDSTCCFKFNYIFDPDIFGCDPYGVKVFKDGDTSVVYSSYTGDSGMVYESHFYDPSPLDFCLKTSGFTTPITVRVAFYNKLGEMICDTITQTLTPCCRTCEEIINIPELYTTHPLLVYKGSTNDACCYRLNFPFFVALPFKCPVFGIKIYEVGHEGTPVGSYQGSHSISLTGVDQSVLDFCLNKNTFTSPKTFVIALYDSAGNVICDSLRRTIEPCYSSSGCNCGNMFSTPNFSNVSTIRKDTSKHYTGVCCFTFMPFTDSTIIKCPYYGFRIYRDSNAQYASSTYLDTLNPSTPLGGPGAPASTDTFKFCLNNYLFNDGPQTLRIEYLDSAGKVICSKTEKISCEASCCDGVVLSITKDTTETDPNNCCISIFGHLASCYTTATIELTEYTDSGWVTRSIVPASPTGSFYFGNLCRPVGDTTRYMIFIKDSMGKILCHKEVLQICPNCCDVVSYTATYVPTPPQQLDRCCWDINVYPAASQDCNVWSWGVYDSLHHVPASYPPFALPSTTYQGRHCTPIIQVPNPAPGSTIIVSYCITRYLAVYDNNGRILCIKPIKLCCTRTYHGSPIDPPCCPPQNLQVAPNPFNELFTLSMDLTQEMAVAIAVVNSTGAVVYTHNYGMQPQGLLTKEISLAGLPSGIYMLSVNNGQASVQIVKQ